MKLVCPGPFRNIEERGEHLETRRDLIARCAESLEHRFMRHRRIIARGVCYRPVIAPRSPEKGRADLLRAQRHHGVDRRRVDLIDRFRALRREVDPDLAHHLDRERIHARGSLPALHTVTAWPKGAGESFGHLAAGRVRDADEEEPFRRKGFAHRRISAAQEGTGATTSVSAARKTRRRKNRATFTSPISTGTSTRGPDHRGERDAAVDAERRDGDRDGELEVVRSGGERRASRFAGSRSDARLRKNDTTNMTTK